MDVADPDAFFEELEAPRFRDCVDHPEMTLRWSKNRWDGQIVPSIKYYLGGKYGKNYII